MSRRRRNVAILVLLLAFLPVAFLLSEHARGRISLGRYKRKLVAKGEKLTARDFGSPSSNGENGAPVVWEAVKRLQEGRILPKKYPPRMKLTPAGRAIVCFHENEWVEGQVTNHWDDLYADLEINAAALGQIRAALAKPVLDNKLDYSQGPNMSFSYLASAKLLTHWFGAKTQLALHDGKA